MRSSSLLVLLVMLAPLGCSSKQGAMSNPKGQVKIRLVCQPDDGVDFSLKPWRDSVSNSGTFTWVNDANSSATVEISGQGADFPLANPVRAAKGDSGVAKPKDGTKPGTYKYLVTATCPDGRKIVVDPDMIIPY